MQSPAAILDSPATQRLKVGIEVNCDAAIRNSPRMYVETVSIDTIRILHIVLTRRLQKQPRGMCRRNTWGVNLIVAGRDRTLVPYCCAARVILALALARLDIV